MPATYASATSPTTQQIVDSIRKYATIGTKIEIQLSSGCFIDVRTQSTVNVSATISVPDSYTVDAVEHKINLSTIEQLNTLLVLTYGTDVELSRAMHTTFYYLLRCNFDTHSEIIADFVEKVLDNLPGNVVQLTSTKEEDTFNLYKYHY